MDSRCPRPTAPNLGSLRPQSPQEPGSAAFPPAPGSPHAQLGEKNHVFIQRPQVSGKGWARVVDQWSLARVTQDAPLGRGAAQDEAHGQGHGLVEGAAQLLHVLVEGQQLVAQRTQDGHDVA